MRISKSKLAVYHLLLPLLILLLVSSACGTQATTEAPKVEEAPATAVPPEPTALPPTDEPVAPTSTEIPPTEIPPTEEPTAEPLPAEPQTIEFQAVDGQALTGRYYPAAVNPAIMIVLMHWAPGDIDDWNEIAFWLQNRGLAGTAPNTGSEPYLDPSWFPPLPEGQSYAVFSFSFRGCTKGCQDFNREGFLMDAQAAMQTAAQMEGIDPERMIAIGASIGSDGAPDGCLYLNEQGLGTCLGALSLSPGSYLTLPYDQVVADLKALSPPKPVWCFYAAGDTPSAEACQSAADDLVKIYDYQGSYHGMDLVKPEIEPNVLSLILEFIDSLSGEM